MKPKRIKNPMLFNARLYEQEHPTELAYFATGCKNLVKGRINVNQSPSTHHCQ